MNKKLTYNDGLRKAWAMAQKIVGPVGKGGYDGSELFAIFGTSNDIDVISCNSVYKALEKIEAYEKEKAEIHVGDVVKHNYHGLVVVIEIKCDYCHVLASDCTSLTLLKSSLVKTDKHVDIQPTLDLLKSSLKGDNNV